MPRLNLPPYRPTSYQESYEHPVDVPQDYIPHKTWVRTEGELLQPRSLQSGKYHNNENTLSTVTVPGSWLTLFNYPFVIVSFGFTEVSCASLHGFITNQHNENKISPWFITSQVYYELT